MRKVYFYIMLLVLANSIYAQFNDPLLSTQNNLFAIEVPTVWQNRTIGENNIVVAVFGMGVDISHPDLNDNIFINTDEIPSNGLDDDNNGYVDDINGWNFYDNNSNILPYVLNDDNYYHETKVAGIIGAEINNGEGIIGVAPPVLCERHPNFRIRLIQPL